MWNIYSIDEKNINWYSMSHIQLASRIIKENFNSYDYQEEKWVKGKKSQ